MGVFVRTTVIFLLLVFGQGACLLNSPFDGERISGVGDFISDQGIALDVSGLWGQLDARVEVLVYNYQTQQWENFTEFYSVQPIIPPREGGSDEIIYDDGPSTDDFIVLSPNRLTGFYGADQTTTQPPPSFYPWGGTIKVPNDGRFWVTEEMGTMRMSLMARVGNIQLPSLDSNSFQCFRGHTSPDLGTRFQDCDSASSPAAHVRASCGNLGQYCCWDTRCLEGFACGENKICQVDSSYHRGGTYSIQGGDGSYITQEEFQDQYASQCRFDKTKTSCKGVVLFCEERWVCPDGTLHGRNESRNKHACGACLGFDF